MTVGVGGAAGAAAIVAKTTGTAAPDKGDRRATSGYKVSAHVENYYRTTKV